MALAVFTVEPPVKVSPLYQEGDLLMELEQYPWLKALLFGRTGIEAFIPKEEWGDYAAYGWTKRMYEDFSSRRASIEETTREGQIWEGAHRQLSQVLLCVLNGERLPRDQNSLKFIDGKWKRFESNDSFATVFFLLQCHTDALNLVADGQLQTNPIEKLR